MKEEKVVVTVTIPKRILDKLDAETKETLRSRSAQIAFILNERYKK